MRKSIILLLALLLALTAAACGDDEGGEATTTAATEETTTTAAAGGDAVLTVSGAVAAEKGFTQAELEALGVETLTLDKPNDGPTDFTGVRLAAVLEAAAVDDTAATLTFIASDGFEYEAALADVLACSDCLLAFDEGTLRLAMPGMENKAWVKEVVEIVAG
ncbi:MAG: Oxidoreductase molybdopterin binding domain [Actinobacteria bacterium]|nr:Oxidoreductase molybdopterin binding domain [Actinomycetota bacterium]